MTVKKWATLTELFVDQMIIRLTGSPISDYISIRRTLITHQAWKLGWLLSLGLQQQVPSTLIRWSPDQTVWRASAPAGLESGGTREGQSEGTDSIRPSSRARQCTGQYYFTIVYSCTIVRDGRYLMLIYQMTRTGLKLRLDSHSWRYCTSFLSNYRHFVWYDH